MTRSNGSGLPPNGWPAGYPQPDPAQPYQNQYPAQQAYPAQPQYPQQAPQQAQQPVTTGRPARIQPPANTQGRPPQYPATQYQAPQQQAPQQAPQHQVPQPQASQYGQPQPGYVPPQSQPYAQPAQDPYAPQGYTNQVPYGLPQASQQAPQYAPQPINPPSQQQAYQAPAPRAPMPYDPAPVPTTRPTAPPQRQPAAYGNPYQQQAPQANYVPPQPAPGAYNAWQGGAAPPIDPQGYDLGAYMPAPVQPLDPRTGRPTAPPSWQPEQPSPYSGQAPAGYHMPDPAYRSLGTPLEAGFEHEVAPQQALEHDDGYDEAHDEDYHDDQSSRPRYGLILASIVAAFAIGGGLTYAYKVFFAPQVQLAGAPVVRSGADPFKVKPADPGGTKFSNTDAKVMDQLNGSDGGPRVVQTMKVERDGTITSGATTASPVSAPVSPGGVPGMILDVGPQRAASVPPATAAGAVLRAADPPKPGRVAVAAPPPAAAPLPAAAAPADDLPAPAPNPPAAKKSGKKAPLPAAAAVGGPKPATGANGYVAVLASVPASASSRMQAMQQFADLQQKYGDVLASKAPDVVEAKLDKGTYHRLVVGPPASRDFAKAVCEKLKAAGYSADCWVTAF